jgi:hypothetical protein
MAYELADGRMVEYDFGLAEIEFMGELTSGRVIFGPDDAEPLLGLPPWNRSAFWWTRTRAR